MKTIIKNFRKKRTLSHSAEKVESHHTSKTKKKKNAFTLIELMVVMAVISILSTVVVGSVNSAREKSKIARAKLDMEEIRTAISLLQYDTGKWPGGCAAGALEDPESTINGPWAGILTAPTQGSRESVRGNNCEWTSDDLANWKGPYWKGTGIDPWGSSYDFDPDYCAAGPTLIATVVSAGSDKTVEYQSDDCGVAYQMARPANEDSDDILLPLVQFPVER